MELSPHSRWWIERLAEQEQGVQSGRTSQLDLLKVREEILALETTNFFKNLSDVFKEFISFFNKGICDESKKILFSSMGELKNVFFLNRMHIRTYFEMKGLGIIHIKVQKQKDLEFFLISSSTIEAKLGPFESVSWHLLGEPVGVEQVARHFLIELIQLSQVRETYI